MRERAVKTAHTPLVRTDFSQEPAWHEVIDAVNRDWEDGFRAIVTVIDDPAYEGWTTERLVLCADLVSSGKSFRVTLPELWAVENNLSLANLDYDDFAGSTDAEGVFRGFG